MQTLKLTKKYTPYPEYKDSGVEWLGKIPIHWNAYKLRNVLRSGIVDGPHETPKYVEEGVPFISVDSIEETEKVNLDIVNKFISEEKYKEYNRKTKLAKDDILFTKAASIGRVAIVDDRTFMTWSPLAIIKPDKKIAYFKYLFYTLKSEKFVEYVINKCSYNTQLNIGMKLLEKSMITIPEDLNEQTKIANYLDEKTSLIDQIIQKKKKQIELLKERRTAFINDMVTNIKGEIVKIKNHVLVNPTKKAVSTTSLEDTISFVPMEALSENGKLELQEKKYKEVKDGFTYFRDGDVVLAKITPCYENGKAGVMKGLKNGFGFGTTEFMVLRPKDSIIADYLYYLIFSDKFRKSGEVEMRGTAGQKRVASSFVKNYEFTLPNIETQEEIVKELNRKTELFDLALSKVEKSVETLQEFKSSLISNGVTGKIKV